MKQPHVTVEARRGEMPTGPIGLMALSMMGAGPNTELWEIVVTCPHGERTVPVAFQVCRDPQHVCKHDQAKAKALEEAKIQIRTAHFKVAPCACAERHWAQHGPEYAMPTHMGDDPMMGADPKACFSAN